MLTFIFILCSVQKFTSQSYSRYFARGSLSTYIVCSDFSIFHKKMKFLIIMVHIVIVFLLKRMHFQVLYDFSFVGACVLLFTSTVWCWRNTFNTYNQHTILH